MTNQSRLDREIILILYKEYPRSLNADEIYALYLRAGYDVLSDDEFDRHFEKEIHIKNRELNYRLN